MALLRFQDIPCEVQKGTYDNGRPALILVHADDRDPVAKATVNLPEEDLGTDEVLVKDYAENEGMLQTLTEAGIVEPTGELVQVTEMISVPKCKLLI